MGHGTERLELDLHGMGALRTAQRLAMRVRLVLVCGLSRQARLVLGVGKGHHSQLERSR